MSYLLIAAYVATIPLANWMIGNVGLCEPNGPCLIPVAPGIMAPSGVLMIGAALVLRDLVQRTSGIWVSLLCVIAGAVLSGFVSPPALALASGAAFLFSELVDFAVYTPLARRGLALAVAASVAVGAMADSLLFLWLAFGSIDYAAGQIVGKIYAGVVFVTWVAARACFGRAPAIASTR